MPVEQPAGPISRHLTVATWNLHEGVPSSGAASPHTPQAAAETVELLVDRRVDIAAFQEVGFDGGGTSELLEEVRQKTPLKHIASYPLHESSFFPGRFSGVAVASRFPTRNHRRYTLPNPRLRTLVDGKEIHSHDKGLVCATVTLDGAELTITSLHAFPFYLFGRDPHEADFKEIWDALAGELRRQAKSGLSLVCGDFNTEDRGLILSSDTLPLASSTDSRSSYRGKSVDDILHGPQLFPAGVEVIDNFSDHRACLVEFRMQT